MSDQRRTEEDEEAEKTLELASIEALRREIQRVSISNMAPALSQSPEPLVEGKSSSHLQWSASSQDSVFRKRHETSLVEGNELMS